ncbi:quinone oxidoreductase [Sphingobium amiense]|uniref:Quinone oxidoreductase n=1 Tax=Sphingobium amiense TaxID=135719 RepID=A0A494W961_9SPHN|nr:zinc-binding dehydrogenase [Sphingobium amiense]BBD96965.1 quinone oxidoreductase [Sphingobium amiense]
MKPMQQVIVDRFGGPEVLTLVDVEIPKPGPGQILVRVEAAGVLYGDVMRRTDRYLLPTPLPYRPGTEIAGVVADVGNGVTSPAIGERVVCFVGSSGYAHYAIAEATSAIALPDSIEFGEATALLAQGVTAYLLTHDVANPQGKSVFIESAAGGVGMQVIQLARARGATFIAGSASSASKREFALAGGADLMIDSREDGWAEQILEGTAGRGIDLAYESSGASFREILKCLSPFGMLVKFGRGVDEKQSLDPTILVEKNQALRGFYLPGYRDADHIRLLGGATKALIDLVVSGALKVHVDHRYALSEAAEAHRGIENRRTIGKVVIEPWAECPK